MAVNEKMLKRSDITIYINNESVRESSALLEAARIIESAFYAFRRKPAGVRNTAAGALPELRKGASDLKTAPASARRRESENVSADSGDRSFCCPACGEYLMLLTWAGQRAA